jgi:hypothetical protein
MMLARRCCNVQSLSKFRPVQNIRAFSTNEDVVPTRYTHFIGDHAPPSVPASIAPVMSLDNMNSKQALSIKKKEMVDKFQMHHADTGSSQVQSTYRFLLPYTLYQQLPTLVAADLTHMHAPLFIYSCYSDRKDHKPHEALRCAQERQERLPWIHCKYLQINPVLYHCNKQQQPPQVAALQSRAC